jgi:hypothetical protein
MHTIAWESKARKQLAKIDGEATRDEIYDSVERLSDLQTAEQVKKLANHKWLPTEGWSLSSVFRC